ncbi:MAG: DUF5005 domain-containing protein, partial [Acidobacteriota bacterium]
MTFYTAPTIAGTWTQLGSTVVTAGTTSIFSGTAQLEVGSVASGIESFQGSMFKIEVRNGINGTVVANPDFTVQAVDDREFADAAGRTWLMIDGAAITSPFAINMRIYNPNNSEFRTWGRRVMEHLADRMTMWWNSSDTDTPDAVHSALATYYGCNTDTLTSEDPTLVDPAPIVADLVAQDDDWDQQTAKQIWQKWANYRRNNTTNNDWAGGDGHIPFTLPDGRALWVHGDTAVGAVDADESRTAGSTALIRNSIVVENADGTLGATLHHTGSSGPSIVPADAGSGFWYWPGPGVVEGQNIRMFAFHAGPPGFTYYGVHIVTLDLTTLAQTDATLLFPYIEDFDWGTGIWEGPDYTYIVGGLPGEFLSGRCGIARAPVGNILGTWEFWDGSGWTTTQADAARLRDASNNEIPVSNPDLIKLPNGKWLLCGGSSALGSDIRVYLSDVGPSSPTSWVLNQTINMDNPDQKDVHKPYGGSLLTYGISPVPHNSPSGRLVFAYSTNWSDSTP